MYHFDGHLTKVRCDEGNFKKGVAIDPICIIIGRHERT